MSSINCIPIHPRTRNIRDQFSGTPSNRRTQEENFTDLQERLDAFAKDNLYVNKMMEGFLDNAIFNKNVNQDAWSCLDKQIRHLDGQLGNLTETITTLATTNNQPGRMIPFRSQLARAIERTKSLSLVLQQLTPVVSKIKETSLRADIRLQQMRKVESIVKQIRGISLENTTLEELNKRMNAAAGDIDILNIILEEKEQKRMQFLELNLNKLRFWSEYFLGLKEKEFYEIASYLQSEKPLTSEMRSVSVSNSSGVDAFLIQWKQLEKDRTSIKLTPSQEYELKAMQSLFERIRFKEAAIKIIASIGTRLEKIQGALRNPEGILSSTTTFNDIKSLKELSDIDSIVEEFEKMYGPEKLLRNFLEKLHLAHAKCRPLIDSAIETIFSLSDEEREGRLYEDSVGLMMFLARPPFNLFRVESEKLWANESNFSEITKRLEKAGLTSLKSLKEKGIYSNEMLRQYFISVEV